MIRVLKSTLLTLVLSSSAILPACAEDSTAASSTPSVETKTTESKTTESTVSTEKAKSSSSSAKSDKASRAASFLSGCVVGIPIAMVRRTGIEIAEGTRDLVGDNNNWFLMAPAGILTVPFGTVSGAFGGVLYGVKNAWVGSGDEPFSKDSFSLGDM